MAHVEHTADEISLLTTEGASIIAEGYLVQVGQADSGEDPKKFWVTASMCPDALVASWRAVKAHESPQVADTYSTLIGEGLCTGNAGRRKRRKHSPTDDIWRNWQPGKTRTSIFIPKPPKPDKTTTQSSIMPDYQTAIQTTFFGTSQWLLDPSLSKKKGIVVEITNTLPYADGAGWHNGDYEGAKAIVLSVFDSGINSFASRAHVKIVGSSSQESVIRIVPAEYLAPVRPDEPGTMTLILDGDLKGDVAKVREEDTEGWFISVGKIHFVVATEKLVQWVEVDDDGNRVD